METPLPLNYGNAGGVPLAFEVPDDQTFDGGFLRIFISTRYLDLTKVAQPASAGPRAKGLAMCDVPFPFSDVWDAITIPIKLE